MKTSKILLIVFSAIMLTSCVSKKDYEALKLNYNQCLADAGKKESTIVALNSKIQGYDDKINLLNKQVDDCNDNLANCLAASGKNNANIEVLLKQAKKSQDLIDKLRDSQHRQDSLNLALSNKLKRSLDNVAAEDVDVKVLKGVVFISLSDKMLYKSGSYEISPSAESVLSHVAQVINDYPDYDVLVEGHTDSDPVRTSVLKDNWDLSALRATAVVRELQHKFNVNPVRMTAGGRGEYVPKTSNLTEQGKAENRRTEIIIMPQLNQFMDLMDQTPDN